MGLGKSLPFTDGESSVTDLFRIIYKQQPVIVYEGGEAAPGRASGNGSS